MDVPECAESVVLQFEQVVAVVERVAPKCGSGGWQDPESPADHKRVELYSASVSATQRDPRWHVEIPFGSAREVNTTARAKIREILQSMLLRALKTCKLVRRCCERDRFLRGGFLARSEGTYGGDGHRDSCRERWAI